MSSRQRIRPLLAMLLLPTLGCGPDYGLNPAPSSPVDARGDTLGSGSCFSEIDGRIVFEAERFAPGSHGIEAAIGPFSGVTTILAPNNTPEGAQYASYTIEVLTPGRWYFWARTYAADHADNDMFLYLNGVKLTAPPDHEHPGAGNIYLRKAQWSWEPEWHDGGEGVDSHEGPVSLDLTAGTHVFTIAKRKGEPHIDKIVFSRSDTAPTGSGPAETPCPGLYRRFAEAP